MSDSTTAEIFIGGTISRELIPDLIEALWRDEATHEYGDALISEDATEDDLLEYLYGIDDRTVLRFRCDQAPNGEFPRTENFCQQHGLAFDRVHDSFAGYVGERARYRPGMTDLAIEYVDVGGQEVIAGKIVRAAMAKMDSYSTNVNTYYHSLNKSFHEEGMRMLKAACPTMPPALESFNVIA